RVPARTHLPLAAAGRRGQPRASQGPVGPAGGDGRAPGHRGPQDLRPSFAVPGDGHPESDRAGGHVPAPRGPARPLPHARADRLPRGRGRGGDPAPRARARALGAGGARRVRPAHPAGRRDGRSRGGARPAHGAGGRALPGGAGAGLARCRPLRRRTGATHRLGREPPRVDRARALRARTCLARRPRLRHPGRRARDGARRVAPPRPAVLRGHRRGLGRSAPGAGPAGAGAPAVIPRSAAGALRARLRGGMAPVRPPAEAPGGVAPTLAELVALRGLAHARVRVPRGSSGLRAQAPSLLRGRGMEYAESRGYTAGDDARHIDWKLTARSGKPHTKLFQAERERLSLVLADTAPALYFGTRARFKSTQAARAGAIAAWRAVADGDRVAVLRGSHREPPVPAAGGARGALRVLDALVRWYARPPGDDAGLEVGLDHAARLLRPGARLLVLADPASVA